MAGLVDREPVKKRQTTISERTLEPKEWVTNPKKESADEPPRRAADEFKFIRSRWQDLKRRGGL